MLIRDPRTRFEAIEAVLENAVKAIPDETKRIEWFESCLERAARVCDAMDNINAAVEEIEAATRPEPKRRGPVARLDL
jgi:predicted O-linked N-acetylglucosamine transferase (SPINDLY family)